MSILGVSGYNPYQYGTVAGYGNSQQTSQETDVHGKPKESEAEERAKKRAGLEECETCKNRKYQDGSDEQVSFKSASHISPEASAARVRGHEQEHVSNAYSKAAQNNGKVLSCSVSLKTAICPECGRSYVAGGTTSTSIKYSKEDTKNPYAKDRKAIIGEAVKGQNLDIGA